MITKAISNVPTVSNNQSLSKGQVKGHIGILSPESLRTEHEYSALLSTGAEEHNSDGSDDLTNLCMVAGDVVASAHTRLGNLKSYSGQVMQENTRR